MSIVILIDGPVDCRVCQSAHTGEREAGGYCKFPYRALGQVDEYVVGIQSGCFFPQGLPRIMMDWGVGNAEYRAIKKQ